MNYDVFFSLEVLVKNELCHSIIAGFLPAGEPQDDQDFANCDVTDSWPTGKWQPSCFAKPATGACRNGDDERQNEPRAVQRSSRFGCIEGE